MPDLKFSIKRPPAYDLEETDEDLEALDINSEQYENFFSCQKLPSFLLRDSSLLQLSSSLEVEGTLEVSFDEL